MPRPCKLSENQIAEIKRLYSTGMSANAIGEMFGVDKTTILFQLGKLKKKPTMLNKTFAPIPNSHKRPEPTKKPFRDTASYKDILKKQSQVKIVRDDVGYPIIHLKKE